MLINLTFYGELSQRFGGKYLATKEVLLPEEAKVRDLYAELGLTVEDVSYLFINATLTDALCLGVALEDDLQDGDHLGIFSKNYVWPYPYTDESVFSDRLRKAFAERDEANQEN